MVHKNKRELTHDVNDWMHHESKAGKDVSDSDLAAHFGISLQEAQEILGELDHD